VVVLFVVETTSASCLMVSSEQEKNVKTTNDIINNFRLFIGLIGIWGLVSTKSNI
jgi:hypothetical protein